MAEIRKHRPATSAIGDLVRANIDAGPRPLAPGGAKDVDPDFDPFFSDDDATEAQPTSVSAMASTFGVVSVTEAAGGSWLTISADDIAGLGRKPAAEPDQAHDDEQA